MCGIAGVFGNTEALKIEIEYCFEKIKHRGPDGFGCAVGLDVKHSTEPSIQAILSDLPNQSDFIGIHTRLSILDLSNRSLQPRALKENKVMLFNGEIYNFKELAKKYNLTRGVESDTQVLEQLFEFLSVAEVLKQLKGMFAIVLYDDDKKELTLARDRFGIKPLYYKRDGSKVRFASEIKALRGYNESGFRNLNLQKFLLHGLTDDTSETFFLGVNSVEPSTILTFDIFGSEISREVYYDVHSEKHTEDIRALYSHSLVEHLTSDAKLAYMLSGGLDSSLNVLCSRELFPRQILTVLSGVTSDIKNNERHWSENVARIASAKQTFVNLDCDSVNEIDEAVYYLDEPFVSLTVVGQSNIFREASHQNIKVMLSGQGADETFAGYHNFIGPYLYEIFKERKLGEFLDAVIGLSNATTLNFTGVFLRFVQTYLSLSNIGRHILYIILYLRTDRILKYSEVKRVGSLYQKSTSVREHSLAQIKYNNLPMLLRYEDRNSMRHGVESRVPFLDHKFVESVINLNRKSLIVDNKLKGGMKRIFSNVLPSFIINRRDKVGFVSDMSWVDQNINHIESFLYQNQDCLKQVINFERIGSLFKKLPKNRELIWRIYCFAKWIKVHNVSVDK